MIRRCLAVTCPNLRSWMRWGVYGKWGGFLDRREQAFDWTAFEALLAALGRMTGTLAGTARALRRGLRELPARSGATSHRYAVGKKAAPAFSCQSPVIPCRNRVGRGGSTSNARQLVRTRFFSGL
jgi:hypothetical protein